MPEFTDIQKYSARLAGRLAERYGHLDEVVCGIFQMNTAVRLLITKDVRQVAKRS
ncbi:hypothetical protein NIE88_00935 [Sporolactobacillus shoreicorticis]|uniref:Uncharacterized protein n=1 Tax=Sporolactobacillus shoreicorticis TaxID=1923877 RepID=A0ABW5S4V9_9BACL|nr:hypothetical protein [Sporolactobacillus shoreicorticis]MCO7124346.1 hypothetical protein [Sporolactobacillus shoreicorticis]